MTKQRKRETAKERDERIVAEAGPWVNDSLDGLVPTAIEVPDSVDGDGYTYTQRRLVEAVNALCRIANRIAKKATTQIKC